MPRVSEPEKRLETKAVHNALNNFKRFCGGSKVPALMHLQADIQAKLDASDKPGAYDIISAYVDKTGDYSGSEDLSTVKEGKLRRNRDNILDNLQKAGEVQICHFEGCLHFLGGCLHFSGQRLLLPRNIAF